MTELMDRALDVVRGWPSERQSEAAEMLLALDRLGGNSYAASAAELASIDEAIRQIARGERATDEEVEAAFARFRK